MAKKCPPGVICIENITIIFLISLVVLATFVYYKINNNSNIFLLNDTNTNNKIYPKMNSFILTFLQMCF